MRIIWFQRMDPISCEQDRATSRVDSGPILAINGKKFMIDSVAYHLKARKIWIWEIKLKIRTRISGADKVLLWCRYELRWGSIRSHPDDTPEGSPAFTWLKFLEGIIFFRLYLLEYSHKGPY